MKEIRSRARIRRLLKRYLDYDIATDVVKIRPRKDGKKIRPISWYEMMGRRLDLKRIIATGVSATRVYWNCDALKWERVPHSAMYLGNIYPEREIPE